MLAVGFVLFFFSLMSHQFLEALNEPWEQAGEYVGNGFCGRNKIASGEVYSLQKEGLSTLTDIQK